MPCRALMLQVEAGGADAMSDALLEAGAHSVALEQLDMPQITLHVLLGLEREPSQVVRAAAHAAGLRAAPAFTACDVADEDWVRRTQTQFGPTEIGARLWIGPSWHDAPGGRVAVRLDPGLAFGTGTHPTTKLVLRFLEQRVRGGERVLDYGCGSGILAIAAAKLGAARADAVDVDPLSVETADANARANGVEVRACLPDALPAALYDMVVSNILALPLILLAPLIAERTARGGLIALAGILESQAAEVAAAYDAWFDVAIDAVEDGWALLTGRRR